MRAFRQLPIYLIGRMLPAAIGFIGIALYTRLLDPASFGTYALLLTTSFLIGTSGFAWLRIATLRMMAAVDAPYEADFAATIVLSFAGTAMVVAAVTVVAVRMFDPAIPPTAGLLTAATAVASGWFELNITMAQARTRLITLSVLQVARAVGILGCSVFLISKGLKANALLGGFVFGNCVAVGSLALWLPAVKGTFRRAMLLRMIRFGWPSTAGSLSLFSTTFQRYMLAFVGGDALVGVFAAANDFAQQTVGLLISTATLAGQPLAYRARDVGSPRELAEQLRNNARLLFAIGLGSAVGLVALAGPLAHVYLGSKFRMGAEALIAVSAIHCFIGSFRASYFEQAFEIALDTRPMAIISALRIVLTVVLSVPLIYRYGPIGAAVATLIAEVIGMAVSIVWARRIMPIPLPLVSFAKVAVAAAAMVAVIDLIPHRDGIAGLAAAVAAGTLAYSAALALLYVRQVRSLFGSWDTLGPVLTRS